MSDNEHVSRARDELTYAAQHINEANREMGYAEINLKDYVMRAFDAIAELIGRLLDKERL